MVGVDGTRTRDIAIPSGTWLLYRAELQLRPVEKAGFEPATLARLTKILDPHEPITGPEIDEIRCY